MYNIYIYMLGHGKHNKHTYVHMCICICIYIYIYIEYMFTQYIYIYIYIYAYIRIIYIFILFIYYHYQHGTSPDTRGRNHDSILTPQKAPRCLETPDERCTSSRRSQGKQTYISQMGNLPVYYGTPLRAITVLSPS